MIFGSLSQEDFDHFYMIVDDLCGAGKTVADATARLRDEGLTKEEADYIVRKYMERRGG